jgi:hypothetical protein
VRRFDKVDWSDANTGGGRSKYGRKSLTLGISGHYNVRLATSSSTAADR